MRKSDFCFSLSLTVNGWMQKMLDEGSETGSEKGLEQVARSPRYKALVSERARFSWLLTIIMMTVYFGYILVIAFDRALLSRPLAGGVTTWGIPIGIGVILVGIALTGVYVLRANRRFDGLEQALRDEAGA